LLVRPVKRGDDKARKRREIIAFPLPGVTQFRRSEPPSDAGNRNRALAAAFSRESHRTEGPAMDAVDTFLRFAAECEQMARRTSDREDKYAWRQLAQRWQRCAELRKPRGASQGTAEVVPLKRKAASRRAREATAA
jgi:hypothetical protein